MKIIDKPHMSKTNAPMPCTGKNVINDKHARSKCKIQ